MIALLAIIFTITVIVLVHELGHFTFAKLFGVRVEKFSIGFPPVIYKKKIGETEYAVGATPLGGFVKMSGMLDESMDSSTLTGAPHEFMSKNFIQKFLILSGGVLFNIIFAYIVFTFLFTVEGKTVLPGTTVAYVDSTGSASKIGFWAEDKILAVNGKKVHNWDEITAEFMENLGKTITFTVLRNGKIKSLVFTKDLFETKGAEYLGLVPHRRAKIGSVMPDSPASKAGLMVGDSIIAINGGKISGWSVMSDSIRKHPGEEILLTVIRNGEEISFPVTPEVIEIRNESGPATEIGRIGIGYYVEHINYGFISSLSMAMNEVYVQGALQVKGMVWLITGRKSPKEMLGGPVAIAKMAGQAASFGFLSLLSFIALLNIILAIINILPIPALDGGHIVIAAIEAVIRKPLPDKVKITIQQVGMVFLMALMLFAVFNDFLR